MDAVAAVLYLLEREAAPHLEVWAVDFGAVSLERQATVDLETLGLGLGWSKRRSITRSCCGQFWWYQISPSLSSSSLGDL